MLRTSFHWEQKTWVSNREKQFSHVLTHESLHMSQTGPRITSGKILFHSRPSGLAHTNAGGHLTWLVLPAPRFMLSFFVDQIFEAIISHSPPVFKKKNPLEKHSLFSSHLELQLFFAFALLVLCKSRSTLKRASWHFKKPFTLWF